MRCYFLELRLLRIVTVSTILFVLSNSLCLDHLWHYAAISQILLIAASGSGIGTKTKRKEQLVSVNYVETYHK